MHILKRELNIEIYMAMIAGTQMKCIVFLADGIHQRLSKDKGGIRINIHRTDRRFTR